jgi:SatD family (SatD)
MTKVKSTASASADAIHAALIGDLVDSRQAPDRRHLHRKLVAALARVESTEPAVETPQILGDEFQASYSTVGAALHAAFLLRLELLPDAELRFGVGWGRVTVLDPERGVHDGPAWWSARAAIDWSKQLETQAPLRLVRTSYRSDDDSGPSPEAVNAALTCRDHLVGSLDERSLRILGGLVTGRSKADIAADEGISPSAVSQRAVRDGLDVILSASAELRLVR